MNVRACHARKLLVRAFVELQFDEVDAAKWLINHSLILLLLAGIGLNGRLLGRPGGKSHLGQLHEFTGCLMAAMSAAPT